MEENERKQLDEKIRSCAKALKKEVDQLTFVEEEVIDLLLAISDHLISEETKGPDDLTGYVTVNEFLEEHIFISKSSLLRYCRSHDTFRLSCARFHDGDWYLLPRETVEFFKESPMYNNRMENIEKILKKEVSPND